MFYFMQYPDYTESILSQTTTEPSSPLFVSLMSSLIDTYISVPDFIYIQTKLLLYVQEI